MFSVLKLIFCVTCVKQKLEYYFQLFFNSKKVLVLGIIFCVIDGNTNPQIFFKFFKQKQKYICTRVNFFRYSTQKKPQKMIFRCQGFSSLLTAIISLEAKYSALFGFWSKNTNGFTLLYQIFEQSTPFFNAKAQHFGAKTKCFWVRLVFCVIQRPRKIFSAFWFVTYGSYFKLFLNQKCFFFSSTLCTAKES